MEKSRYRPYKSYYEFDFKIFITDWKKKLKIANLGKTKSGNKSFASKRIGRLWTAIGYYKKYIELSSNVFFPSIYKITKGTSKCDVVIKKNEEVILTTSRKNLNQNSLPKWLIDGVRDNLGREVILQSTHPDWVILHASPWRTEEIFSIYSDKEPKKRKELTFLGIYENFIINNDVPKFISYFRTKIYITDNHDRISFLITKCESDTERFISVLKQKLMDDNSKVPVVFLGQLTEDNLKIIHENFMKPIFNKSLMYMRLYTKEYENPFDLKEDFKKKFD